MFIWDHSNSDPFWNALKAQPILSNEVQCFKALIVIHKVLLDGPQFVSSTHGRRLVHGHPVASGTQPGAWPNDLPGRLCAPEPVRRCTQYPAWIRTHTYDTC